MLINYLYNYCDKHQIILRCINIVKHQSFNSLLVKSFITHCNIHLQVFTVNKSLCFVNVLLNSLVSSQSMILCMRLYVLCKHVIVFLIMLLHENEHCNFIVILFNKSSLHVHESVYAICMKSPK